MRRPISGLASHRPADQRVGAGRHREGVGQQDRRLQLAEFLDLHQPDALAEAVQHLGGGDRLVAENVAVMRQDGGDAGAHVAFQHRGVTDRDPRHVGDRVARAGRQGAAGQAKVACSHRSFWSSASRRPSPSRLKASTVTKIARPGNSVMWSATPR